MPINRCQLHLTKLEEFAAWAISLGFKREEALSRSCEVLRLRWEKEPPLIFYTRGGCDHATIPLSTHGVNSNKQRSFTHAGLVTRWLRSKSTPAVADTAPLNGPGDSCPTKVRRTSELTTLFSSWRGRISEHWNAAVSRVEKIQSRQTG